MKTEVAGLGAKAHTKLELIGKEAFVTDSVRSLAAVMTRV